MKTKTLAIVVASLGGMLFAQAQTAGGAAGTGAAGTGTGGNGVGTPTANTGLPAGPTTNAGTPLPANLDPAANLNPPTTGTSTATPANAAQGGSLISTPASQIPQTAPGTTPIGPQPPMDLSTSTASSSQVPNTTAGVAGALPTATSNAALPTQVGAPSSIIVNGPPPPPRPEPQTTAPGTHHSWVPGHYSWQNGTWAWVSGQWAMPPQRGLMWVPGVYDPQTRMWVEGHWEAAPGGDTTR
jgi:hypothetical protein